ncbi:MAG: SusC/RagA family TonB-linked outer membrane protein [Candidatus Marinimicrobia bacterium]|nr:SusC/RagA family TonB-linked outer membrane protein [Candidatus Neomarinimicrobiota bacterium]MDD9887718.1 SusC/RagA family TonB-linked outer membrane protein [Candidatus Neomarinimicrobiota bacterium]MDD9931096.1 SusC/RagA family TonB-linked outer membrane protein [Candidatus Neomarinimicrobiota bacterium]
MKSILKSIIFASILMGVLSAQSSVTGTVTDDSGNALAGANVVVEGTSIGAAAGSDGTYMINVPAGTVGGQTVTLTASYIGHQSQSAQVTVPESGNTTQNFSLAIDAIGLKAVSVTALGFEANRDKQGSTSVSVTPADMTRSGEATLANSLAAKASSVIVNSVSGDAGAGTSIKIRGYNTISGSSQPLIIVDGMPINNSQNYSGSSRFGGSSQQSRMNDLNANDIKSVEVLKGASAAALWGSRAANGVIVIRTKDGAAGSMKMSYKRTHSFDEIHERLPMQTTYGQGRNGSWGTSAESWGDKIADRSGGADEVDKNKPYFVSEDGTFTQYTITKKNSKDTFVDKNFDQAFQTGTYVQDDFQVSGGDAMKTYLFSYGRLRQDGIIRNSYYDRDNVRLNTKFKLSDRVSMSSKASYTYVSRNGTQRGSNVAGLLLGLLRTAPDFDNTYYKGSYWSGGTEYTGRHRAYRRYLGGSSTNPIYNNPGWTVNEQKDYSRVNRWIFSNEMTINPYGGTEVILRGGLDQWTDNREGFYPVGSAGSGYNSGSLNINRLTNRETNYDVIARQNFELGSDMSLVATGGWNLYDRTYSRGTSEVDGFLVPTDKVTTSVNTAAEASSIGNSRLFIRSIRAYGVFSLDLFDQIFMNLSLARETHSTISDAYNYPAFDVAYQFSDMASGLSGGLVSFAKLRVAYGKVGVRPSAHAFETLAESGFGYSSYSDPLSVGQWGGGYRVDNNKGNDQLKPEVKTETEFGVDLRMMDDKLSFSFTSYNNTVDDMLISRALSPSSGFSSQYSNAAKMTNKGLEIDGSWNVMNQNKRAVELTFNWSKNENMVKDLAGTDVLYLGSGSVNSVAREGYPIGVLWGTGSKTKEDGSLDLNANGFPQITSQSIVLGDPNPDWRGTLGLNARMGALSLNVLFEHSQGGDYSPRTQWVLRRFGTTADTDLEVTLTEDLKNYDGKVIPAGTTLRGEVKDFGGGNVVLDETWFRHGIGGGFGDQQVYNFSIKDATFSRIRELSLAYDYRSDALTNMTGLQSLTFTGTARNLFAWYKELVGVDPGVNVGGIQTGSGLDYFANPSTKSFLFSFTANF